MTNHPLLARSFAAITLSIVLLEAAPRGAAAEPDGGAPSIQQQAAAAVRNDPTLRGVWLDFEPLGDNAPGYHLRRVFDRRAALQQWTATDQWIGRLLGNTPLLVDGREDQFFPVSDLVDRLQDQMDLDPRLAGCLVEGACFERARPTDPLRLVLLGRVDEPAHAATIELMATALMQRDPEWALNKVALAKTSESGLRVVAPSAINARLFFADALQAFWKRDYASAVSLMKSAAIEAPQDLEYQYWRVLCDLALGNALTAQQRMENIVRTYNVEPLAYRQRAIIRSMERIQGPLRQELRDLETEAVVRLAHSKPLTAPANSAVAAE